MVLDQSLLLDNSLDIQLKLNFLVETLYQMAYNELEFLGNEHSELVDRIRGLSLFMRGVSQEYGDLLKKLNEQ